MRSTSGKYRVPRTQRRKPTSTTHRRSSAIARNETKQAHLQVDSAIQAKKTAEKSGDMNKINDAQKSQHAAEDQEKASQARVAFLQAYVTYLQRFARYTAANMYWHEAKFESTKAQIAKSNNIAPRGVQYDWFPPQLDDRQKQAQTQQHRAEQRKQAAFQAHDAWMKQQHQADIESGKQTVAWDPLAPAVGSTGGDQPAPSPMPTPMPPNSDTGASPQ